MGIVYGLGAALGFGLADFVAALVARRIGTFRTLVVMQAAAVVLFTLYLVLVEPLPELTAHQVAGIVGLGTLALITYGLLYGGLAIGPVAIVSPVSACYALVTVGLAVAFLGERPSALTWAGVFVSIAGVVLVSTDLREARKALSTVGRGVLYGLGAMVGLGLILYFLAVLTPQLGWFAPVYLMRAVTALILLGLLSRDPLSIRVGAGALVWLGAVAIAVLDTGAWMSYGIGVDRGYTTSAAIGSSAYPMIPVVLGVVLLRERLVPNQRLGVLLILLGLLAVGLG